MTDKLNQFLSSKDWKVIFDWYPSGMSRLGIMESPDSDKCSTTPFTRADVAEIYSLEKDDKTFELSGRLFDGRYIYIVAVDTSTDLPWTYHHGATFVSTKRDMMVPGHE